MKVNLDNMTLTGHLYGGQSGQDFQVVSGFNLNATLIPEPSTLVLAGLGLCGAFVARRRIQAR
jgi:hypothetical protein